MATHRRSIMGPNIALDTLQQIHVEPGSVKWTSGAAHLVTVYITGSLNSGIHGTFEVPSNYVSNAKVVAVWSGVTAGGSGVVKWQFKYRLVATGEDFGQSISEETVDDTFDDPANNDERQEASLTLTGTNFVANETCQFTFSRDQSDAADTYADATSLVDLVFEYDDA